MFKYIFIIAGAVIFPFVAFFLKWFIEFEMQIDRADRLSYLGVAIVGGIAGFVVGLIREDDRKYKQF